MPEGDTLFRTAHRLRAALDGCRIESAYGQSQLCDAQSLVGRTVVTTEARGKHLLIRLDSGDSIHSHLGMTGSWHLYQRGERWRKPSRLAALTLNVAQITCVCFSPKTLELLSATAMRRHPYLARLGPDLLGHRFDLSEALGRFRQCDSAPIGEAVMNQTLVSGIGNIYKSEVLFLEEINPFVIVQQLPTDQLTRIITRAQALLRKNVGGYPRRTRFGHDGQRHWVYRRAGERCLKCGETIELRRQGDLGRSTYWCPQCQRPD